MIYEEDRADQNASHVLLLTSDPVYKEQIKGIIVRIGGGCQGDFLRDLSGEAY